MDLRKSKSSEIFNLLTNKGVVEFLEGVCAPCEIINPTDHSKLFVIPAGGGSSNLPELLMQDDKIEKLFKSIEEIFDIVIIDSSPIDPVSDSYVLAKYCDTTLFVVRHGYTPKTIVQLMDENKKIKVFNNLFIVFNAVKPRGFIKRGFGYGYGYGYEYVYKNHAYKKKI